MVDQMEFAAVAHQRGIENQHNQGHNHHHHHHHQHYQHHHQQQQQQPQFNDDNPTSYVHSQSPPIRTSDSLRHHLTRNEDYDPYDQLLGVASAVGAAPGTNILNHLHQQRQQLLPTSLHLEGANQLHLQHLNNNNTSTTNSTTSSPTCQQSSQNQQQLLNTPTNSTTSSGGRSNSGGTINNNNNNNNHNGSQRSGGKKWSKRIRTTFTPEQLKRLEDEFTVQMYLVGEYRQFLAKSLGLSEGQVKVWFQNRRIKHRKLNK